MTSTSSSPDPSLLPPRAPLASSRRRRARAGTRATRAMRRSLPSRPTRTWTRRRRRVPERRGRPRAQPWLPRRKNRLRSSGERDERTLGDRACVLCRASTTRARASTRIPAAPRDREPRARGVMTGTRAPSTRRAGDEAREPSELDDAAHRGHERKLSDSCAKRTSPVARATAFVVRPFHSSVVCIHTSSATCSSLITRPSRRVAVVARAAHTPTVRVP